MSGTRVELVSLSGSLDPGRPSKLSVVIPAFNEEATVGKILRRCLDVAADLPVDVEFVVVDNGSSDSTTVILAECDDPRVQAFRLEPNQGKGGAVRYGISQSTGDLLIIQDADLEYDPADWPRMLEPVLSGKAQAVWGSRFMENADGTMRASHRFGNRLFAMVVRLLYGQALSDPLVCYKLMNRRVAQGLLLTESNFRIDAEITGKLLRSGVPIVEVPIRFHGRSFEEGKKIRVRHGFGILWVFLKTRFARRPRIPTQFRVVPLSVSGNGASPNGHATRPAGTEASGAGSPGSS
ncbi:MAG: glycosyltransferase family 2 protein [Actinobacteria bacterium]|nr:glycosyltransferase family 2 protein [Actinomycetota bacterium]